MSLKPTVTHTNTSLSQSLSHGGMSLSNNYPLWESKEVPIGNTCCFIDEQQLSMKRHNSCTMIHSSKPSKYKVINCPTLSNSELGHIIHSCFFSVISGSMNYLTFLSFCRSSSSCNCVYLCIGIRENKRKRGRRGKERFEGLTWAAAGWVIKFFNLDLLHRL